MFKRIKKTIKLWRLADKIESEVLDEEVKDGAYLPDMTESEMADWLKDNELGWGKFKDKLRDILK